MATEKKASSKKSAQTSARATGTKKNAVSDTQRKTTRACSSKKSNNVK